MLPRPHPSVCVACLLLSLAACRSNDAPLTEPPPEDGSSLKACLERPSDLPRPPINRLPCELIPPGLEL
jgi:hypothetical protein